MSELLERGGLLAQLASLRERGGQLAFLGGEAGVGKTALVRAFATTTGDRILRGSCENLATPTPLGPFIDVGIPLEGGPRGVAGLF